MPYSVVIIISIIVSFLDFKMPSSFSFYFYIAGVWHLVGVLKSVSWNNAGIDECSGTAQ